MELDELKIAWQTLDRRLQQHDAINLQLFKHTKLEKARSSLRPLFWGQALQLLLGIGLVMLGIACWTRNTDIAGLLVAGIVLHAFGLITAVVATITLILIGSIDYSAPVLKIQKQLLMLLRFYTVNAKVCGLPWWVMWVVVVVAFAGLGRTGSMRVTPAWIWASLALGIVGLLGTWGFALWQRNTLRTRRDADADADANTNACFADGGDGIRRSQRILDEITRFETE